MASVLELTLAAYRVREEEGPDAASHMYLYGTLQWYEPIANEEHLTLILNAITGLEWGKLEPFKDLVSSGYAIPKRIRSLFKDLVEGHCHYGYSVEVKRDPKFRGLEHQTPFGQRRIIDRNMSIQSTYDWEMEHNGKNRNDAKKIRHELAEKYGISEKSVKKILSSAHRKKDKERSDALMEQIRKRT